MPKILITGGGGVLGSSLSELFLKLGCEVVVTDIARIDECWRLIEKDIIDQVEYKWKASQDISENDIKGIDMVVDCAIGFPDRPFGNGSPRTTIDGNLVPAIGLLETLRKLPAPPLVIYPSSFNALYGTRGLYDESTHVNPTSIYGWTKAAVEQLYRTYHYSFGMPIIITRVGSSYGKMMRTDELIAKVIISNLQERKFSLRSPNSKRLWTYLEDVISLYEALVKRSDFGYNQDFLDKVASKDFTINVAGNAGDEIVTNVQIAKLIGEIMQSDLVVATDNYYEPGEMINGSPVEFTIDAEWSRGILGKSPKHSLRDGIRKTVEWFTETKGKVGVWNTHW